MKPTRSTPDDHGDLARALAPLAQLLAPLVAAHIASGSGPARTFSQLDGERPIGAGPTKYLRAWRRGRDAGDPECTAEGRARLMTAGAWARHGASAPKARPVVSALPRSVDADVAEELGLVVRR